MIMKEIRRCESRNALRRAVLGGVVFSGALAALVPTTRLLVENLAESGFIQAFSLVFSDGGNIALYAKDLFSYLLESLPFASVAAFLFAVLVAVTSSYEAVRGAQRILFLRAAH